MLVTNTHTACCVSQSTVKICFKGDWWFLYHFVPNLLEYICANNYFTVERFDKVIAEIKWWCSFFGPECRFVRRAGSGKRSADMETCPLPKFPFSIFPSSSLPSSFFSSVSLPSPCVPSYSRGPLTQIQLGSLGALGPCRAGWQTVSGVFFSWKSRSRWWCYCIRF